MKNLNIEALKELMTQYNAKRAEWIVRFGSDDGFDAWFTAQVQKGA